MSVCLFCVRHRRQSGLSSSPVRTCSRRPDGTVTGESYLVECRVGLVSGRAPAHNGLRLGEGKAGIGVVKVGNGGGCWRLRAPPAVMGSAHKTAARSRACSPSPSPRRPDG